MYSQDDIVLELINGALELILPKVNPLIDQQIKEHSLDPWQNVTGGCGSPGQYCVEFPWPVGKQCVGANAIWSVCNLRGLSSLHAAKLVALSLHKTGDTEYSADVMLTASLGTALSGSISGTVEAKLGPVHPAVNIGGNVTVQNPVAVAQGTITVSYAGGKVCISDIALSAPQLNTGVVSAIISGLDRFSFLADEMAEEVATTFKPQLLNLLSSKLTPIFNNEINSVLPFPK